MKCSSRIYVAGHQGMVGSAIFRALKEQGYNNIIVRTRRELDLTDPPAVLSFFKQNRPEYVFLAAAKVGGIIANSSEPALFFYDNIRIQNNILHSAYLNQVKRLLFLGSSCIYPKEAPQPLKETYLLSGYLEPTNSAYAIAKIAGIEMCRSYNASYGTQFLSAMPANLYGINDNYHPTKSHVLPGLLRRLHEAKTTNQKEIVVWGDGTPLREFLYADDLAAACIFLLSLPDATFNNLLQELYYPLINIGSGQEYSISTLAIHIAEVVGFTGSFRYDTAKPNGTMRKIMDSSRLHSLGWQPKVGLTEGLKRSYADFLTNTSLRL